MRKWSNDNRQRLILGVTLLVLIGLLTSYAVACTPAMPDPEMPEFEGTVLTNADVDRMVQDAEAIEDAGGAQNSTILLVHEFQETVAVLVCATDISSNEGETLALFCDDPGCIPLFLDCFYACSLSLQEDLANLATPDAQIGFLALGGENEIFGSNLGRIKQAVCDVINEYGENGATQPEDVFVVITPEDIQEVAELLGTSPEDLRGRLEAIPPWERLTWEGSGSGLVYDGVYLPQPTQSWWGDVGDALRGGVTKVSLRVLPLKLFRLIIKYGAAIADCYSSWWPDMDKIEYCLVQDHGLNPDVVERIIEAILDP